MRLNYMSRFCSFKGRPLSEAQIEQDIFRIELKLGSVDSKQEKSHPRNPVKWIPSYNLVKCFSRYFPLIEAIDYFDAYHHYKSTAEMV